MSRTTNALVECALIDLHYALAEVQEANDKEALMRAIEHAARARDSLIERLAELEKNGGGGEAVA